MKITISTKELILLVFYCSYYKAIEFDSFKELNEVLVSTRKFNGKDIHIFTDFSEENYDKAVEDLKGYGLEQSVCADSWFDEEGTHRIESNCLIRTKVFDKNNLDSKSRYLDSFEVINKKMLVISLVRNLMREYW